MSENKTSFIKNWIEEKSRQRGRRALERQLEYQEDKAKILATTQKETFLNLMMRTQAVQQRLEKIRPISESDKVLEVGSGAHGLIFGGFGKNFKIGVDPLAIDYKRLFPLWQKNSLTLAAIGEKLPFPDASFEVVLSDNVIDHAENPVGIIDELIRVLKPEGLLYFTVNVHHPIYNLASKAHGVWNAVGLRFEISPFADHTIHFSEKVIRDIFSRLPIKIIEQNSSIVEKKASYRRLKSPNMEQRFKKFFYKNANFEIIAIRN